jgi:tRNA threonylcarbamoyladenosine biosynthesis protein TsaB
MPATNAILALDASTGPCSVAIWLDGKVTACEETLKSTQQSARLLPMTESVLAQSGIGYKDLTAIAATIGPGSFTGIRIALAAAQGIAMAAGLTPMGFGTLEVLAFAAQSANPSNGATVLALINAGKGECYYQYARPMAAPLVGTLEAALEEAPANHVLVAGNVLVERAGFSMSNITYPRADALARLAASGNRPHQPLRPLYIRPPDAKLPKEHLTS